VITQVYDPGLGTLPSAQGFAHVNIPSPGPALVVEDNRLKQDTRGHRQQPSNRAGYQWFRGSMSPADLAGGMVLTWDLEVISSSYDPDFVGLGGVDSRSAGYGVAAIDDLGRSIILGISASGVFLHNDFALLESTGSPYVAFDTTSALHHYELTISALGAALKINDVPIVSLPLGPTGGVPPGNAFVGFGDAFDDRAAVPSESVTELAHFTYTIIPEPASFAALAGLITVLFCRRPRGERT
jgi:hypothetical protein